MPLNTTLGQLMVNEALPEDMRDYTRELNKKSIQKLLSELAETHPEKYRDTLKKMTDVGRAAATSSGGHSFNVKHLRTVVAARQARQQLDYHIKKIMADPKLDDKARERSLIIAIDKANQGVQQAVLDEARKTGNPLAKQIASGARGNVTQLNALLGATLLHADHRGRPIPYPVMHTFSEGMTPAEWWATSYGSRKGLVDMKLGTGRSGYFAKQLNQLAHKLMVVAQDAEEEDQSGIPRGLPVDIDDPSNEGSLLAYPVGEYKRNTVLTPKILAELERQGTKRILVRSPTVGGPADGIYARDAGVREFGRIPNVGDMVGLTGAQAISERVTQGALGAKHRGSEGASISGFDWIQSQISVPKHLKGGAAHAEVDGKVTKIEDTGTGGKRVWVEGKAHFVPHGFAPSVKVGDAIEAGDVLSDGIPNPKKVVEHKGIGEGRRYFLESFTKALGGARVSAHRRNVELVARGAIDLVEMLEPQGDMLPGDMMSYSRLESQWQPRATSRPMAIDRAAGKYLERPVLHYSIGTKVRPSVIKNLQDFGVKEIDVDDAPPPFQPVMVRSLDILGNDPDVMTRFYGSGQKKSLTTAVHRGQTSDTRNVSFVPALAEGARFGKEWPGEVVKGLG